MVVHCETNCNEICPTIEKTQRSLKIIILFFGGGGSGGEAEVKGRSMVNLLKQIKVGV